MTKRPCRHLGILAVLCSIAAARADDVLIARAAAPQSSGQSYDADQITVTFDPNVARGIEALGQRVLTLAGALVLLVLGVLPAAVLGGLVAFASLDLLGPAAFVLGSVGASGVILLELYVAATALGRVFDRFDLSR